MTNDVLRAGSCWLPTVCWISPMAGGLLCGKMLGDLGADVVQVEPPGGSPARRVGPFYKDEPGAERSPVLVGIFAPTSAASRWTLLGDDGAALLRRLVANADFLIESGDPGRMASLGLGYRGFAGDQFSAGDGVHHGIRAGRALRRLPGVGHRGHGVGRLHAPDRRRRPAAAAGQYAPVLPARQRRGGCRCDDRPHPPPTHRRRAARGRILPAGRGADAGARSAVLGP